MMKYSTIIFDLYGTLVDNFLIHEHEQVIAAMAKSVLAPCPEFTRIWLETYKDRALGNFLTTEDNIKFICRTLEIFPNLDQIKKAATVRLDFTRRSLYPRPNTIETLSQLKLLGIKIGLISDCSSEVPITWEKSIFSTLVDVPIFSCKVGIKKPDPKIYDLACVSLKVKPEECLYIGDGSSFELSGAYKAGMTPVLISASNEINNPDVHKVEVEEWNGLKIQTISEVWQLMTL